MKTLYSLLILALPICVSGQTQTENYIKETTYKVTGVERYTMTPVSINPYTDILYNGNGGVDCSTSLYFNSFKFDLSGSWSSANRLRLGIRKTLSTTPALPNMEMGQIMNGANPTGYFAKIENNNIVFYSPYFPNSMSLTGTIAIPGGSTLTNSVIPVGNIYTCTSGGSGGGSGSLTVNRNATSGTIAVNISGGWSEICSLKTGIIIAINSSYGFTGTIELGTIKSQGLDTAFKARIVNNNLEIYQFQAGPSLPTGGSLHFVRDFGVDRSSTTTYIDGLGRAKQVVSERQSPNYRDIITHKKYDNFGNEARQYMGYQATSDSRGAYIPFPQVRTEGQNFYYAKYKDSIHYSEKLLERSNASRELATASPGETWRLGSNNEIRHELTANNALGPVRRYDVTFTSNNRQQPNLVRNGDYQQDELMRSVTKTENWKTGQANPEDNTVTEFTDRKGRVILKRAVNNGKWYDTNYVYDDFDNLTYVLTPQANVYSNSQQIYVNQGYTFENVSTFYAAGATAGESNEGYVTLSNNSLYVYFSNYGEGPYSALNTTGIAVDLNFNPPLPDMQLGPITIKKADGTYSSTDYTAYIQNGDLKISGNGTIAHAVEMDIIINMETANITLPTTIDLDKHVYQYVYDERNRMIQRKIPGKGWEYIVYDKQDRVALTQDAELRLNNKWLFTKYDTFGRPAYAGVWSPLTAQTRQSVQSSVNSMTVVSELKATSGVTLGGTTVYYSNYAFPVSDYETLTISYYDNYTFDIAGLASEVSYSVTPSTNAKTLPTGTKSKVLNTSSWITTVNYYDDKGREIFSASKNDYLAITDKVKKKFDFEGKILEIESKHIKGAGTTTVLNKMAYDNAGRLAMTTQQINSQPERLIAKNTYDETGQLIAKEVGNTAASPLQKVDYDYNIRGWLKNINNINRMGNDLFAMNIGHNDSSSSPYTVGTDLPGKALYDGNISNINWKTDNTKSALRGYHYKYDRLSRLTEGHFSENSVVNDKFYEGIGQYDRNGNILKLNRLYANASQAAQSIDNLEYKYDGDKLLSVKDWNGQTASGIEGVNDTNTTSDDFDYDLNGNLKLDNNKKITKIEYNHLNLPNKIVFQSADIGSANPRVIQYKYDAGGNKIEKVVLEPKTINNVLTNTTTTTQYDGGYVYENGVLQFISNEEGYAANNSGTFSYVYNYKDHLGNVRLSYADSNNNGTVTGNSSEIFYDGFENGSGWESQNALYGWPVTYDTTVKHSGNASGKLTNPNSYEMYSSFNNWISVSNATATDYIISGWVYSTGPSAELFLLQKVAGETQYTTVAASVQTTVINRWVYLEQRITVGANIVSIVPRIDTNSAGTVWFDDINIRKVNASNEIVEESNYYPFGMKHKNYNNTVNLATANASAQKFKFGNKEFDESMSLNTYDFGARNYDPAIGRWMNIDALAEKSRRFSTYSYSLDNPIYFKDPDGMQAIAGDDWIVHEDSQGHTAVTYHIGITTKQQAIDAGYKGVSEVWKSGSISGTDSQGSPYFYQLAAGGTVGDVYGNSMPSGFATPQGTWVSENPISRYNMFFNGMANTTFGIVGAVGAAGYIAETGGLGAAAGGATAFTLSMGEVGIGIGQMGDAFAAKPSDILHDYSTVPGLIAAQRGSEYAPLIDGISAFASGPLTIKKADIREFGWGHVPRELSGYNSLKEFSSVNGNTYHSLSAADATMDATGFGSSVWNTFWGF